MSIFSCASRKFYASTLPINPTAYVFPVHIDDVSKEFRNYYFKYHNGLGFDLREIFFHGDGKSRSDWGDEITQALSGEEHKHDIWMRLTTDSSTVYYGENSQKLAYIMECKAHCTAVDSSHTRISIEVYSSKVTVGESLLPSPSHFVNNPVYRKVKSTTVEEYKILLCFGKGLGVDKQMPALKTN